MNFPVKLKCSALLVHFDVCNFLLKILSSCPHKTNNRPIFLKLLLIKRLYVIVCQNYLKFSNDRLQYILMAKKELSELGNYKTKNSFSWNRFSDNFFRKILTLNIYLLFLFSYMVCFCCCLSCITIVVVVKVKEQNRNREKKNALHF